MIDDPINNLVFAGLTIEQMSKIPKWLLENMEKNKAPFEAQLLAEILEGAEEYDHNDVMMIEYQTGKPIKAIPVSYIKKLFGDGSFDIYKEKAAEASNAMVDRKHNELFNEKGE